MRVEKIGLATQWTRIYALCEADWTPRYVGKTVRYLHERHKQHIRVARQGVSHLPVRRWLRKRIDQGAPLAIKLLENVASDADWREREAFWISTLRAEGHILLNLTDGGEGLAGHRPSQQHRDRIAEKLRTGATFACETCGSTFWRKRNEIERGNARFCSRACYARANLGRSKPMPPEATARGLIAAAAKRRAQTLCKHGHHLSGENLAINKRGARVCITCRRASKQRSRAKGLSS